MTQLDPTHESPATPDLVEEVGVVEADVLVEDVSIDGMCGVY
jgi:mycofactocin precursor